MSVFLSLRKVPMIRYLSSSEPCAALATRLTRRLRDEYENNTKEFERDGHCVLLILDRREDPITPLLNQWTYQAMLHEMIGINNNRIDIRKGHETFVQVHDTEKDKTDADKEFVISQQTDPFFNQNMYANFGELAQSIKEFIDQVAQARQQSVRIESLEDMQRAMELYPELKKLSGNLTKHVTLSSEISKLVEERMLMNVSKIEQKIACEEAKNEHFRMVMEQLADKNVQNFEKLKLVIMYALRYENDTNIEKMKDRLREGGISQNMLNLIN